MNNVVINIEPKDLEDFHSVERIFREYKASQELLGFLMSKTDINDKMLNKYIDRAEYRNVELNLKKEFLSKYLLPCTVQNKKYNYTYDFDNETIIYTWEG